MTDLGKIKTYAQAILDELAAPAPTPAPPPTPTPTPPVIGGSNAFGPAELLTKLKGAKGGETFVAKIAEYGAFDLSALRPASRVTVICEAGGHFERLTAKGCANLTFDGPQVWPVGIAPPANTGLIHADAACDGIHVLRADVRSAVDAGGYYDWDLTRWKAEKSNGAFLLGANSLLSESRLTALNFAAQIGGSGSALEKNKVRGFSEDSLRLVGNGSGYKVIGNDIADCVSITGGTAHPDGFQAWSRIGSQAVGTGLLSDILIEDNLWREWIGPANSAATAIRIAMQVIGWHNGTYANATFRRNHGWTNTWWGLHLHNCTGALIEENAFFDIGRKNMQFGRVYVTGASSSITSRNNVSGDQKYPAGSVVSGNTKPDYATLPAMSLAD